MLLGRGSKILLGFGPWSHLLYVEFPGCTSKALLVAGCCCFFFCFFVFRAWKRSTVDVKVSSDFFSLGRRIAFSRAVALGIVTVRLDVLILYIKVSWFLKTDQKCHFGISYWYPILELTVIFASRVRNPWGYQKSGILQSSEDAGCEKKIVTCFLERQGEPGA